MAAFDYDKYFCYDTKKIVRIRDRYLGITLTFLYGLIWTYIVLGVFYFGEGYLSYDMAKGGIATHVKGDIVATSINHGGKRYYSAEEVTYPALENGNVFVATRETITKQTRGVCDDPEKRCEKDSDCTPALGGTCSKHGFCHEAGWCTAEGSEPDQYDLDTMNIEIWIKSFVHYSLLDRRANFQGVDPPFIYSTSNQNYTSPDRPKHGYNLFSVNELLRMCKPVPVRFEEVAELGAAIEVVFSWECYVQHRECKPVIKARRLDVLFDPENIGFAFKRVEYLSETERMLHGLRGVRIFFQSVGKGSKVDINALLLKLATTTSLLCLAPIISDIFMLKVFNKRRRYYARKFQKTQHFSEIMDDMHEHDRQRTRPAMPQREEEERDFHQRPRHDVDD